MSNMENKPYFSNRTLKIIKKFIYTELPMSDQLSAFFIYRTMQQRNDGWGIDYGYARVSTKGQNERRQIITLQNFGIARNRIDTDKQSGKDFERAQYKKPLQKLNCKDTLMIHSIVRLGRNNEDMPE